MDIMSDCVKRCLLSALLTVAGVCICDRPAIAAKNPWLNCGTLGDVTSRGVKIPAERLPYRLYRNAFGLVVVWVPIRPLTSNEIFAFRGVGSVNIDVPPGVVFLDTRQLSGLPAGTLGLLRDRIANSYETNCTEL
jgi:hypothetical protein